MGLLLFYLFIAIAVSFVCSVMEAVILSSTISYIEKKELEGKKSATLLKKLKENIDRPLSAILSLNTVAHTIGAAGVGAQAVAVFGEIYFGLISAILTIMILIFSEIIPKTLAARYWRELALTSAKIIHVMIIIAYPLVLISEVITRWISKGKKSYKISRDEMAAMAFLGHKEGVFDQEEQNIIFNVLRLRDIKVKEIMTPRTVVVAANENMTISDFFQKKEHLTYSRVPIFSDKIDNPTGYVLKDTILEKLALGEKDTLLKKIKRPAVICYELFSVDKLFELLIAKKEHISIIVDEYGGMEGVATMEDIIETLLGFEITDESDRQANLQTHAREQWKNRSRNLDLSSFRHNSENNNNKQDRSKPEKK